MGKDVLNQPSKIWFHFTRQAFNYRKHTVTHYFLYRFLCILNAVHWMGFNYSKRAATRYFFCGLLCILNPVHYMDLFQHTALGQILL